MPRLKTLYHASPENVNILRPRYSPKLGGKGLFVSSDPKAMKNSWVGWAALKDRHPGRQSRPRYKRPEGSYKTVTLYTLTLPMEDYQAAVERHWKRHDDLGDKATYGGWYWDEETFIPEDLMKNLKIVGKKTASPKELTGGYATNFSKTKQPRTELFKPHKIKDLTPEQLQASAKFLTKEEIQELIRNIKEIDLFQFVPKPKKMEDKDLGMARLRNRINNRTANEDREKLHQKLQALIDVLVKQLKEEKMVSIKTLIFGENSYPS